jgi:hypothetical protein
MINVPDLPSATGLIEFVHYAKKADYLALPSRNMNTLYLISDSEEVFLGDRPYGGSVIYGAALPPVMFTNKLYAITTGEITRFYKLDGTMTVELKISGTGSGITADSVDTLTNKTLDVKDNTIKNLTLGNFAENVVLEDFSEPADLNNQSLATSIAVYNLIVNMLTIKHFT